MSFRHLLPATQERIRKWRQGPGYAFTHGLLIDAWLYLLFGFLALSGLEALLPTFVSARINLGFLLGGLLLTFALLDSFPPEDKFRKEYPPAFHRILLALIFVWAIASLLLSVIKFPFMVAIIILIGLVIGAVLLFLALREK